MYDKPPFPEAQNMNQIYNLLKLLIKNQEYDKDIYLLSLSQIFYCLFNFDTVKAEKDVCTNLILFSKSVHRMALLTKQSLKKFEKLLISKNSSFHLQKTILEIIITLLKKTSVLYVIMKEDTFYQLFISYFLKLL